MKKVTIAKPKFNVFRTDFTNLITLVQKELSLFFNNTLAYIVIAVSIILHFFLFFIPGSFFAANQSDLTTYFVFVPWIFILLIPTLTMGSISNEEKDGTIEFILSKPIGVLELILSKLLSVVIIIASVFVVEALLLTPILFWGNFDLGKIAAQYIAVFFLALSFSGFGVLVSSITRSQISSFLVSAVGIFIGLLMGVQYVAIYLPAFISKYLERLSILSHYNSMLKGSVELSDILYFLGATIFCVFASYYVLMSRKLPKSSGKLTSLGIFTLTGLAIIVLVTALGQRIPGKLDLTKYQVNTLTDISKKLVSNSPEEIKFKLYYSDALPPQFQSIKRDFFNMIREYENAAGGKLKIEYISTESEDGAKAATEAGMQQLRFQEQGAANVKFSVGYLGMGIEFKDQKEIIASVVDTNNLEYEISGIIKSMTVTEKKKVGILTTKVEHSPSTTLSVLQQLLSKEFDVTQVEFTEDKRTIDPDINTLIIAGPNEEMSEDMKKELRRFFNDGGAMFFMSDPASEDTMSLTTNETPGGSLDGFFEDIGIKVHRKLVYDLQSFLSVNYQQSFLPVPYPYFPVALSTYSSPINSKIDGIGLRWPSYLTIDKEKTKNLELVELFHTSPYAGYIDIAGANINPDQDWNQIDDSKLEKLLMAVSIIEKDDKPGRAVIVPDADFISDDGIPSSQNAVFVLSSIEWLTQDQSLAAIKAKERLASPLNLPFISTKPDGQAANVNILSIVQFGGPIALVGIVGLTGIIRSRLRKRLMKKVYVI